jgi:hypothetical protein
MEGQAVAACFDPAAWQILTEAAATPEAVMHAVRGKTYLHFACHGFHGWQDPMRSGLRLAGDRPLTMAEIITRLDLSAARLVTLSACETGLIDIRHTPDEYIGLSTGFLLAGAPGVVSALWPVHDDATRLLMERFYALHLRISMKVCRPARHYARPNSGCEGWLTRSRTQTRAIKRSEPSLPQCMKDSRQIYPIPIPGFGQGSRSQVSKGITLDAPDSKLLLFWSKMAKKTLMERTPPGYQETTVVFSRIF